VKKLIIVLAIMAFQGVAWSSEPSKVLMLDEITVKGKAINVSPPPPSATIITGEELQDEYFENTQSILDKIPGAVVREYGQGGVASSFVMRGLQLGHNTGAAFFVDGVPLNESTSHGDGYADVNSIIPEDIDYIEIIKGPSSALYGQFARGGVINIVTKRKGNFNLYKFGIGDWDRQRFAMSVGREDEKLSKVFGAEISRSEGAAEHSKWLKSNVVGKASYDFSEVLKSSVALNFNAMEWDHPEYLTQAQWDAGDYWSGKPLGGGERYRYGGSNNWTYRLDKDSFVNFMGYAYRSNLTRYRDQDTRVDEEYHDRDIYGGSTSYAWNTTFGTMKNALTVGLDGQVELTHTINAQNPSRIATAREKVTVDGESTLNTYSLFFQNQLSPTDAWKITLGGRYDHLDGILHNKLTAKDIDMEGFNVFSPKAALEFMPVQGYTLFATYGEGFRLPNGFDKFTYPDLSEESYIQYELGVKLGAITNLDATLTGFLMDVDNEIVSDIAANTKRNEGKTRRKGIELELKYSPMTNMFINGSVSYTKGEYTDYINSGVDYSGTDIPFVPDWLFSFGLQWKPPEGFFAGIEQRYVGEGYKDNYAVNYNGVIKKTVDYTTTDVQLGYKYKIYTLTLDVSNIFDERYPSNEGATTLRTGSPRGVFLNLSINY